MGTASVGAPSFQSRDIGVCHCERIVGCRSPLPGSPCFPTLGVGQTTFIDLNMPLRGQAPLRGGQSRTASVSVVPECLPLSVK